MSTTTIRLPPDLKERIARAAERAGTTAWEMLVGRPNVARFLQRTSQRPLGSGGRLTTNTFWRQQLKQEAPPYM